MIHQFAEAKSNSKTPTCNGGITVCTAAFSVDVDILYNELNSVMELSVTEVPNNGSIVAGTYQSQVGAAGGIYTLSGITDEGTGDPTPNIGFAVSWVNPNNGNSNSVPAWSGQLQIINGQEVITVF
jgi:hypothetical protein